MGHSKNKLTIRILSIISAISILCLCVYVPDVPAKATNNNQLGYYMTYDKYVDYIEDNGLDQNDYYMPSKTVVPFTNIDNNYPDICEQFFDYINSDYHFTEQISLYEYNVVTLNYASNLLRMNVFTSEAPIWCVGSTIISYNLNSSVNFAFKNYILNYSITDDQGEYTFSYDSTSVTDRTPNYTFSNTLCYAEWENSLIKYNIYYSDAEVHSQGYIWGNGNYDSSYSQGYISPQAAFDLVNSNYEGYNYLPIDRRTCIQDYNDTLGSPEDRYITERSRCGADDVYFYISGTPDNLSCNYGIVPNRYTIANRSHCYLELYYVLDIKGNYEDLEGDFRNILMSEPYSNKYQAMLSSDRMGNYTYNGYEKDHKISISLSEVQDRWEQFNQSVPSYFVNQTTDVIRVYPVGVEPPLEEKDVPLPINDFIGVLSKTFGYSYSSGTNFGGTIELTDMFKVNGQIVNSSSKSNVSNFSIEVWARIVDTENSSKNTGLAKFTYNCITGDSTYYGDPIIYDDDDIVDDPDAPVPTTPPTTEVDPTQPTTQTVVVDGGKNSVVVTNTNNNTNNPTFNNSPTVNVTVSGGGSDSSTETDGLIVIKDDDSVEFEDVQDVMDGVENFLDFGDTYFDEYIGTLLSVIPVEVWRPFAISSAFIALACMIGYILRR